MFVAFLLETLGTIADQDQINEHKTSWIVSLQSGIALFLLAVLLPAMNHILKTVLLLGPTQKDLSVAQINCLLNLFGNLIISLASTDKIMLLGE